MKNNLKYINQSGLTVITPLDPSKNKEELVALITEIGKDDWGGGIVDFQSMSTVHFSRWFIMDKAYVSNNKVQYTEKGKYPDSLVFTTNFDGDLDSHLEEVVSVAKLAFEKIYSYCEGFPCDIPSEQDIINFLKAHKNKNQLFWPSIRGGTVEQLKGENKLRDEIQSFLNDAIKNNRTKGKSPQQIKELIIEFVKEREDLQWALTPRAKTSFGWKFKYYGALVLKILLSIPIGVVLGIWFLMAGVFNKKDNKYRKAITRSQELQDLLSNEDRSFMNQLTIYAGIKKPYWFRITQLKMGLWFFALNGMYVSSKGKLSGIETIHFARWSIFNKGKNVIFLSNYDGAWQIYLSEFIDRSAGAMNLTFGTFVGYPRVKGLIGGGAHDEQKFKTVVRNNQYPTQVFYSAYPRITVKNMLNNNQIRKGIDGSSKESVSDWLKRF